MWAPQKELLINTQPNTKSWLFFQVWLSSWLSPIKRSSMRLVWLLFIKKIHKQRYTLRPNFMTSNNSTVVLISSLYKINFVWKKIRGILGKKKSRCVFNSEDIMVIHLHSLLCNKKSVPVLLSLLWMVDYNFVCE